MTRLIGLRNLIGAKALAGWRAGGLIGLTGSAENNGICCVAVLELPVGAACSSLNIFVLGSSACTMSVS